MHSFIDKAIVAHQSNEVNVRPDSQCRNAGNGLMPDFLVTMVHSYDMYQYRRKIYYAMVEIDM